MRGFWDLDLLFCFPGDFLSLGPYYSKALFFFFRGKVPAPSASFSDRFHGKAPGASEATPVGRAQWERGGCGSKPRTPGDP